MFLVRGLRAVLAGLWLVFQPALRFIAWVLLLAAAIALIADLTRTGSAVGVAASFSTLADAWQGLAPKSLAAVAKSYSAGSFGFLWDPLALWLLSWPIWLSFTVIGLSMLTLARPRSGTPVFAN